MNKPASLRAVLTAAVPTLAQNPERLLLFITDGRVECRAPTLSFEYAYTLKLIVLDFADHMDLIVAPILDWVRKNQIEMFLNKDLLRDGFKFETDILSNTTVDIEIDLKITERVGITESNGTMTITHFDEPNYDEYPTVERWELYIQGELVRTWPEETP